MMGSIQCTMYNVLIERDKVMKQQNHEPHVVLKSCALTNPVLSHHNDFGLSAVPNTTSYQRNVV